MTVSPLVVAEVAVWMAEHDPAASANTVAENMRARRADVLEAVRLLRLAAMGRSVERPDIDADVEFAGITAKLARWEAEGT